MTKQSIRLVLAVLICTQWLCLPAFAQALGDINGDGVVNAVDVQIAINSALGIENEDSHAADINGDGQVNAVDVQLVINAALGISIGTPVPDVVGLTEAEAESALTSAGLAVGDITEQHHPEIPEGHIISQNPAADVEVLPNTAVDLVRSLGPPPPDTTVVPNLVGLSQVEAGQAIALAELSLGEVTESHSSTVPEGHVISQSPNQGTSVPVGTAVDVDISLGPQMTVVPDVIGMTLAEAEAALTAAGLVVGTVLEEYHESVEAGRVIFCVPQIDDEVIVGFAVELTLSLGPEPVSVPNVVGMTQSEAEAALLAAGLSLGTTTEVFTDDAPVGEIVGQNPEAGASVEPGTSVNIILSAGPAPVSVPNVVGMTQSEAEAALDAVDLLIGAISEAHSDTVAAGLIISQKPDADASVLPGTAVDFVVSLGPILPTAAFSATPTSGVAPLTVNFLDESDPGSFPITAWQWEFGDGNESTAQNPSHIYQTPGTYTVSLTVATAAGNDTAVQSDFIQVQAIPTETISGTIIYGPFPLAEATVQLQSTDGTEVFAQSTSNEDGTFSLEIEEGTLNDAYRLHAFSGEYLETPFDDYLAAMYSVDGEGLGTANISLVTTLIADLADLDDTGAKASLSARESAIERLSELGVVHPDEWRLLESEYVDWNALFNSIDDAGGIEPWFVAFVEDLEDDDLAPVTTLGFPLAHGGIFEAFADVNVFENDTREWSVEIMAGQDPPGGFLLTLPDAPEGMSVTGDGNLQFETGTGTGDVPFTLRITNVDTLGYRNVSANAYIMPTEVLDQGTIGVEGGLISDAWDEVVLDVPEGAVEGPTPYRLLRGILPTGNYSYGVRFDASPGQKSGLKDDEEAPRPSLYLPNPELRALELEELEDKSIDPNSWERTWASFLDARTFSLSDRLIGNGFRVRPDYVEIIGGTLNLDTDIASYLFNHCGTSRTFYSASHCAPRIPVLLVHGYKTGNDYGGGVDTWADMPQLLQNAGYAVFEMRYRSNARFQDLASDLARFTSIIAAESGQKVHVVAHSFGGLVARTYLQGLAHERPYQDDVASLITLGTPHSGIFKSEGFYQGRMFPDGTDNPTVPAASQLSSYQAGDNSLSVIPVGDLASILGVSSSPGEIVAQLADFNANPLTTKTAVFIGLATHLPPGFMSQYPSGDKLISYDGQRFHPSLRGNSTLVGTMSWVEFQPIGTTVVERILHYPDFGTSPGRIVPDAYRNHRGYRHGNSAIYLYGGRHAEVNVEHKDRFEHHGLLYTLDWLNTFGPEPLPQLTFQIRATIFDSQTGLPLSGARVQVISLTSGAPGSDSVLTNSSGEVVVTVPFTANARYGAGVSKPGYRTAAFDNAIQTGNTPPATTQNMGTLYLYPDAPEPTYGNLSGTVRDLTNGAAVSGVQVELTKGSYVYRTTTNASGQYTINNLPSSDYTLRMTKTGYQPYSSSVSILGGTTRVLDTGMAMTANPAPPSNRFVYVPSGVFQMGRPYAWPAAWAQERTNEVPVHNVYLSAYYIGKYPITNYEFAEFLSWIYQHWTLHPEDIYINPQGMLVYIAAHGAMLLDDFDAINFQLVGGRFVAKFPNLPVTQVTWNAAALYCNWRNELEGLPAVYDVSTWELYSPLRSGYRLPTEAEWERAAAWDGARHWRYGNMSDSISCAQGNFYSPLIDGEGSILPGTWCYGQKLPVGWFNGINPLTPGSSSTTALSRSPVGAFDMSGYPAEWCHDRYRDDQYSVNALSGVVSNPTGPPTGDRRVLRGDVSIPAPFEWFSPTTAYRASGPTGWGPFDNIGFRVVFSP